MIPEAWEKIISWKKKKRPEYKQIFPEFAGYDPRYSQSHEPVREQKTAEGHAVRAVYMYCAMADLAYEYKDKELLDACKTLWEDMTKRQMYITGSIGHPVFWNGLQQTMIFRTTVIIQKHVHR